MAGNDSANTELPFWRYCRDAVDTSLFSPEKFPPGRLVEFSRVAIVEEFRRRERAGAVARHSDSSTSDERRYSAFKVIPVCLFFAALVMFLETDAEYGVAMMEPRLVRLLRKSGIVFELVGHLVDYHGSRAPYVIHRDDVRRRLDGPVRDLFDEISRQWRDGKTLCR